MSLGRGNPTASGLADGVLKAHLAAFGGSGNGKGGGSSGGGRHNAAGLRLVLAPGRVNLIGEHTDYNDGFVLPAAVDRAIILALAPNGLRCIRMLSLDMGGGVVEVPLPGRERVAAGDAGLGCLPRQQARWSRYILGVVDVLLQRRCDIGGFDCTFAGDIPIGSGMSSSAALESGVMFGLNGLFDLGLDRTAMALIAQMAEHQAVDVQCGIMDMYASLYGREGHVIRLDCRTLDSAHVPFDRSDVVMLVSDTGVRRELAGSEYNIRRRQCEEGAAAAISLHTKASASASLRDVTHGMLTNARDRMDPLVYDRCRYVLMENDRVLAACDDLSKGDLHSLGRRMVESHQGLRDLYEVSCPELDTLVDAAMECPGVLGSRMMGGGFGGCTISLVERDALSPVCDHIAATYRRRFERDPAFHVARIGDGVRWLE